MNNLNRSSTRTFARGFSLVEMLVVTAIIVVLVGLAVVAQKSISASQDVDNTRRLLNGAQMAIVEYETVTSTRISHVAAVYSPPTFNIDWTKTQSGKTVAQRVSWALRQVASASEVLSNAGFPLPKTTAGAIDASKDYEMADAWGTTLMYAAFVDHSDPFTESATDAKKEIANVLPARGTQYSPKPFWASAGPDKDFGNSQTGASAAQKKLAEDNLYSFNIN